MKKDRTVLMSGHKLSLKWKLQLYVLNAME